jgi:ubiquinone/menaquinone biosynthesis C-methylase UbiE
LQTGQQEYEKVGWGSSESMYAKYCVLFHIIDWNEIKNLCDVGCGTGAFEELFSKYQPNVNFTGIDLLSEYLQICQSKNIKNAKFLEGDINKLNFDNNQFDLVVNMGVLQNFNGDVVLAINELCRISKRYLYVVTLDEEYIGYKNGTRQKNQINTYHNPSELSILIKNNGFKILTVNSISTDKIDHMIKFKDFIKPLHETHTFYILAEREFNSDTNCNPSI